MEVFDCETIVLCLNAGSCFSCLLIKEENWGIHFTNVGRCSCGRSGVINLEGVGDKEGAHLRTTSGIGLILTALAGQNGGV